MKCIQSATDVSQMKGYTYTFTILRLEYHLELIIRVSESKRLTCRVRSKNGIRKVEVDGSCIILQYGTKPQALYEAYHT